jgi:hypothetical protein
MWGWQTVQQLRRSVEQGTWWWLQGSRRCDAALAGACALCCCRRNGAARISRRRRHGRSTPRTSRSAAAALVLLLGLEAPSRPQAAARRISFRARGIRFPRAACTPSACLSPPRLSDARHSMPRVQYPGLRHAPAPRRPSGSSSASTSAAAAAAGSDVAPPHKRWHAKSGCSERQSEALRLSDAGVWRAAVPPTPRSARGASCSRRRARRRGACKMMRLPLCVSRLCVCRSALRLDQQTKRPSSRDLLGREELLLRAQQ